ncbi:hypothetical protein ABZ319_17775 [Nocardia sp. NPDC005978]|uniref:hypothetical protein n=1 Tax=Nocardia sp. NPDC005978 TaxID=3156725 RepID=UPI0033B714D5
MIFAAVVLLNDGDTAGGDPYLPGGQPPGQAVKYKPGKVANACDAVDLAAIVRLGYPSKGKPLHEEVDANGTDGSLECQAEFENANFAGQADFGWDNDNELFNSGKARTIATPPADSTAQAISGLGESAYYTLRYVGNAAYTTIEAVVAAKDGNLFVRTTFKVYGAGIRADREDVRRLAEDQARIMLERLR